MLVTLLILVLLATAFFLLVFLKKGGFVKGLLFFAPGGGEVPYLPYVAPQPEEGNDEGHAMVFPSRNRVDDLTMELDDLDWMLNKKKGEMALLEGNGPLAGENAAKLSTLQDTIDTLELRLVRLHQGLMAAQQTAIALDELEISYRMLQNELAHSRQGLQHSLEEIGHLQQQLEDSRDYAAHLKEQQLLLQKKLSVLEELDRDNQAATDVRQK